MTNYCDRPMAAQGLTSYRYKGTYGWIMIGAHDHADALKQAGRSTDAALTMDNLQVWTGTAYAPVPPACVDTTEYVGGILCGNCEHTKDEHKPGGCSKCDCTVYRRDTLECGCEIGKCVHVEDED
jgi:hypothetical protein